MNSFQQSPLLLLVLGLVIGLSVQPGVSSESVIDSLREASMGSSDSVPSAPVTFTSNLSKFWYALKEDSFFIENRDGVLIDLNSHEGMAVTITLQSQELYLDRGIPLSDQWLPVLLRVQKILHKNLKPKEYQLFWKVSLSEQEKTYSTSVFSLSTERAEWLIQYWKAQAHEKLQERAEIISTDERSSLSRVVLEVRQFSK